MSSYLAGRLLALVPVLLVVAVVVFLISRLTPGDPVRVLMGEDARPEQVLRHVPAPRPKIQPKAYRPGLAVRDMTPEQRRLAESWMWTPGYSRPGE